MRCGAGQVKEKAGLAHITGQLLIVLHQLLVLLVDGQNFADPVGRRLRLEDAAGGKGVSRHTINHEQKVVMTVMQDLSCGGRSGDTTPKINRFKPKN